MTQHNHPNCYCSFCGRGNDEAKALFSGPTAYVCDSCVRGMYNTMRREGIKARTPTATTEVGTNHHGKASQV